MKFNNDLVIKAKNGDISAFESIVNSFQDMAIGYAYSILKDYGYAEDAAQEAFYQAYFNFSALQSPEAFPSWFRKIVFSVCEHFYRKKRLPVVPLDDVLDAQSREQSPLEYVERDELRSRIMKAVKVLPEKERTIMVLFYFGEYSMADIGKFLDFPISRIKNCLFAARKKLRGELSDLMDDTLKKHRTSKEFSERVKNMIISGFKQSLLVKEDGTVMTWGNLSRYSDPRTANENAKPSAVMGLKNVKSITASAGCHGSYALLNDGKVWAWGWNVFQHLGTGSKEEYITAPEVVKNINDVISVSAGVSHALALKKDRTVWVWGKNWYGQQGNGQDNDVPAEISSLKKIKQISAGFFHSLALVEDGTVWRWGGYGDSTSNFPMVYTVGAPIQVQVPGKITAISAGGMHSVMLREDGTVWACGYNTGRQLGSNQVFNEVRDVPVQVGNLTEVKAISAGGSFSLALKKDGTVWAWGGNENGELGTGSFATSSKLTSLEYNIEPVEVSMLQDVVEISAGGSHAMAVTSDGNIWVWGGNDEGQLGDFADSKRCVPQKIL